MAAAARDRRHRRRVPTGVSKSQSGFVVGGEEFKKADLRTRAGGVDQDGHRGRCDKSKLAHFVWTFGPSLQFG
jgi:hypothetical protein